MNGHLNGFNKFLVKTICDTKRIDFMKYNLDSSRLIC